MKAAIWYRPANQLYAPVPGELWAHLCYEAWERMMYGGVLKSPVPGRPIYFPRGHATR